VESEATPQIFRSQFVVPGGRAMERLLVLGWTDGRVEIDRDTEIAVEIFCEHLGEALDLVKAHAGASRSAPRALPPS